MTPLPGRGDATHHEIDANLEPSAEIGEPQTASAASGWCAQPLGFAEPGQV